MPVRKIFIVLLFMTISLLWARPQDMPVPVAEPMLRLHVRANSDSPADQALKYQVRDVVLAVMDDHLEDSGDMDQAKADVAAVMPEVLAAATKMVADAGYNYSVNATLGEAEFPTRLYGDQVYRAGTYQAVQIYLGEGSGENWWCVLFPPLCFVEVAQESDIPVAGAKSEAPRPRSRLLEWWQRIFG